MTEKLSRRRKLQVQKNSLKLSRSEFVAAIAEDEGKEEEEEVAKEKGVDEPVILSDNLAELDPILVVSSDDETLALLEVPQIPQEEVEHSFVGDEGADSNSEVEKPPKLMRV